MKKIVFATHNRHKLDEVRIILKDYADVIGLTEIGLDEEIEENAETLEENALIKAKYVFEKYHLDCIADDTGLEVDALSGRPGVHSARYAGEPSDSERNVEKLLSEMNGVANRDAQFRTIIVYLENGTPKYFNGIVKGTISTTRIGNNGFGYDPIFIPAGYSESFAEMSSELKNKISHRALAINKLTEYIESKSK
ncbi:MAG: non-canonical purine NTP diphosphatase [Porphyromonadaceae bacterium]|jgi:XTP/dITP diphosphohydrolase|nr:non-canonical purine NTP diphosphatase [Porphyromonadaceae bacterium]